MIDLESLEQNSMREEGAKNGEALEVEKYRGSRMDRPFRVDFVASVPLTLWQGY